MVTILTKINTCSKLILIRLIKTRFFMFSSEFSRKVNLKVLNFLMLLEAE